MFKIYYLFIIINNYRSINSIRELFIFIKENKIKLKIDINNKSRLLIFNNILYILKLFINLIS